MKNIFTTTTVMLLLAMAAQANIRYVKPMPAGTADGSSWANASADIQAMINASTTNDEVWVAGGTYQPNRKANATGTITPNDRDNAFLLKANVKIYGSFTGAETLLSQRTPAIMAANQSTLSGDFGGNDVGLANNTENAYHVVVSAGAVGTATLDGFTIKGGNANGTSSIIVNAKTVERNDGGAMVTNDSSPYLSNISFTYSNATSDGGGLCNYAASSSTPSSPLVTNCIFSSNAGGYGGGTSNYNSNTVFTNCVFSGNTGYSGGAISNLFCSPVFTNVVVSGNQATNQASAVLSEYTTVVFTNATIAGNNGGGSALRNTMANLTLRNSIVYGNSGAGVQNGSSASTTREYSLVQGMAASTPGNIDGSTDPQFINPISASSAPTTFGYYAIVPCSPVVNTGNNSYYTAAQITNLKDLDGNPRFNGTVDMGAYEAGLASSAVYYVKPGATGTGYSWANAAGDLQKMINTACEGAQVWVAAGTYKPNRQANATGTITPDNRDNSFVLKNNVKVYGGFAGTETTITARVTGNITILSGDIGVIGDNSDNCYHVVVAANVDNTAVLDGVTITLGKANAELSSGPIDINHRQGGGVYNTGASPIISNCVLSYNFATEFGGGMYNTNSSPIITGCTFFADTAMRSPLIPGTSNGGGMYSQSGNPTVNNCVFSGNVAVTGLVARNHSYGGGLFNQSGSTLTISHCTFSGNSISSNDAGGGGISNFGIVITTNCTFSGNTMSGNNGGGAGMLNRGSNSTVTNCVFLNNVGGATGASIGTGGGYQNDGDGNSTLTNCIFVGNQANGTNDDGGGAIMNYRGIVTLTNCTLWNNSTSSSYNTTAHGIANYTNGTTNITNCIVWGASAQILNKNIMTVSYSNIKGSYTGTGNIEVDPSFVNTAAPAGADGIWKTADDGLAINACSPSINTGTTPSPAVPNDYLGNGRVGAYDMGAYEYQGTFGQPPLATSSSTFTKDVITTTTFGDCNSVIATVAPTGTSPVSGSVTAKVYVQSGSLTYSSAPYVRRTYDIRPVTNPDAATATITLYFLQSDFTDYNTNSSGFNPLPVDPADAAGNKANLRIYQQHGTSTTGNLGSYTGWGGTGAANVDITPTSVTYNAALARWEVVFPVIGFSGFFAHTGTAIILPIKLLSFTASNAGNRNRVNWNTATEDPGTSFEITRNNNNGSSFNKIGAAAGKGRAAAYTFYDDQPINGTNYYRLTMIEANGATTFSNVAIVRNDGAKGSISISPIPATSMVTIRNTNMASVGTLAIVYDMQGQEVSRFTLSLSHQLHVAAWAAGIYNLHLADGTTVRLVKQ